VRKFGLGIDGRLIVAAFVALLCCKSIQAQTGQGAAASSLQKSPSAPAYQLLRYDEDWSYLVDPSKRSDALDPLKYIPLNEEGWYVSLGGEARLRYEYYSEFAFGAGPQDSNGYLLERYLFHADFHLGRRVRFFAQLQSGIETGRNGGPRPTDDDRLDLHQAFIDLKVIDEPRQSLTVRIGRHEMDFGAGRLISAGEGLNLRRSFDGTRLIYRRDNWLVNAQVDKLVAVKRGYSTTRPIPHKRFGELEPHGRAGGFAGVINFTTSHWTASRDASTRGSDGRPGIHPGQELSAL